MADNYIARQQDAWLVISLVPDVWKTPIGSSTPPIPYPVVAKLETLSAQCLQLEQNNHPIVVLNQSVIPTTMGDEAGAAKRDKKWHRGGKCYPKEHWKALRSIKNPFYVMGISFDEWKQQGRSIMKTYLVYEVPEVGKKK